jgi:predicted Zn-dependent peptidase
VGTANYGHDGPGIFSIFAECAPAKRRFLRAEVERLFAALRRPTREEMTRAKNLIHNAWLQGFETYHQQASTLGLYALDDHLHRLKSYLPKISALTPGHLADAARRYLHALPLSSAVIEA